MGKRVVCFFLVSWGVGGGELALDEYCGEAHLMDTSVILLEDEDVLSSVVVINDDSALEEVEVGRESDSREDVEGEIEVKEDGMLRELSVLFPTAPKATLLRVMEGAGGDITEAVLDMEMRFDILTGQYTEEMSAKLRARRQPVLESRSKGSQLVSENGKTACPTHKDTEEANFCSSNSSVEEKEKEIDLTATCVTKKVRTNSPISPSPPCHTPCSLHPNITASQLRPCKTSLLTIRTF